MNVSLINFIFNDEEIEIDILKQIKKILTQNAEVAELTDYFVKHPSRLSDDLPLEVLSIVVEEIIMLHRGGVQSIEETKKSILNIINNNRIGCDSLVNDIRQVGSNFSQSLHECLNRSDFVISLRIRK